MCIGPLSQVTHTSHLSNNAPSWRISVFPTRLISDNEVGSAFASSSSSDAPINTILISGRRRAICWIRSAKFATSHLFVAHVVPKLRATIRSFGNIPSARKSRSTNRRSASVCQNSKKDGTALILSSFRTRRYRWTSCIPVSSLQDPVSSIPRPATFVPTRMGTRARNGRSAFRNEVGCSTTAMSNTLSRSWRTRFLTER